MKLSLIVFFALAHTARFGLVQKLSSKNMLHVFIFNAPAAPVKQAEE